MTTETPAPWYEKVINDDRRRESFLVGALFKACRRCLCRGYEHGAWCEDCLEAQRLVAVSYEYAGSRP